jgi:hypothetical protein
MYIGRASSTGVVSLNESVEVLLIADKVCKS